MNDISLKVYVAKAHFGFEVDVAIVRDMGDSRQVAKVVDGGHLEFVPVTRFAPITPTIRLSEGMAEELLGRLLALNIPAPTVGAIEGELKATKVHLADLRQLLKITKRPT